MTNDNLLQLKFTDDMKSECVAEDVVISVGLSIKIFDEFLINVSLKLLTRISVSNILVYLQYAKIPRSVESAP